MQKQTVKLSHLEKQELKLRVMQARVRIFKAIRPSTQYMPFFIEHFGPDVDQVLIAQVMNDRRIDQDCTILIESLATKLEKP
jgi:hypothetical protein